MKYQIVGMMYEHSDQEQAILEDENGEQVFVDVLEGCPKTEYFKNWFANQDIDYVDAIYFRYLVDKYRLYVETFDIEADNEYEYFSKIRTLLYSKWFSWLTERFKDKTIMLRNADDVAVRYHQCVCAYIDNELVATASIDCYAPSIENKYKVLMIFEINE
ncbi:hypothetical protein CIRMBP1257_00511 [Enterococcus cecorum]|nr:hypothetical protein CIRMBP1257_00511 [Enterococcus cecorum]